MNLENQSSEPSTTSVGLRYGLIGGIVIGAISILLVMLEKESSGASWLSLPVSIAMLVLAMQNYKQACGGYMPFGKGMGVGVAASGVSSLVSALISIFYTQIIDPEAVTRQLERAREKMEAQGMSDEIISQSMEMAQNFARPAIALPLAVVLGIFFGAILSLIVAAILQKKRNEFEL
jgi:hypothetical protein